MATLIEKNSVWIDKHVYDEAEKIYYEKLAKGAGSCQKKTSLAGEVAKARERIKQSLENVDDIKIPDPSNINFQSQLSSVEEQVNSLRKDFEELRTSFVSLQQLVKNLDQKLDISPALVCKKPEATKSSRYYEDDDIDLFTSESENDDEETRKMKERRLAEYHARKAKKPVLIAKSNIIFDVKPWDDETDMKELEKEVRKVTMDGLVWGASKLVPLAYGIRKLTISCVVEDEKVSIEELQEKIQDIEDYVQSVDIAAFNKV